MESTNSVPTDVRWKDTANDGYLPVRYFAPNKQELKKRQLKNQPETIDQILNTEAVSKNLMNKKESEDNKIV